MSTHMFADPVNAPERIGVPAQIRKSPTIPADDASSAAFHIVEPNWALPGTGKYAALARMADGRLIAREYYPGMHGKPVYVYFLVPDDGHVRPHPLNSHDDELGRLQQLLDRERAHPKTSLGMLAKTPLEIEVEKFRATWPEISLHMGFQEIKVKREFEIGPVWYSMPIRQYDAKVTGEVDCKAYRDLHCAGDFGLNGKLADVPPLTEEEAWTLSIQPQATKNAEAIRSKLGVVRSEWKPEGPTGTVYTVRAETALFHDARQNFSRITVVVPQR